MPNKMTPRELFEKSQELKYNDQLDEYFNCMAEDIVVIDGFSGKKQIGREVVKQTTIGARDLYDLSWSDAGEATVYETKDPEVIIAEYKMNIGATIKEQRHTLEVADVLIVRVRDDKLVHIRGYSNAQQKLAELLKN